MAYLLDANVFIQAKNFHYGLDFCPAFWTWPDSVVLRALGTVSQWATSQQYDAAAVNTFLQVADYFLVAQALAHRHTVVTHEKAAPLAKKIKIPTACIALGIKCMTPFEMLRSERARFILGAKP